MPEFVAVPIAIVGIGIVVVVLFAADAGLAAWLAFVAVILVALVVLAAIVVRRPRGTAGSVDAQPFEGAAPRACESAKEHLDSTVNTLEDLGFEAKAGHVASHDPLQAADEALRKFPADELVFVLKRSEETEWLERGILDLSRERYSIPVREVTASAPDAA